MQHYLSSVLPLQLSKPILEIGPLYGCQLLVSFSANFTKARNEPESSVVFCTMDFVVIKDAVALSLFSFILVQIHPFDDR